MTSDSSRVNHCRSLRVSTRASVSSHVSAKMSQLLLVLPIAPAAVRASLSFF